MMLELLLHTIYLPQTNGFDEELFKKSSLRIGTLYMFAGTGFAQKHVMDLPFH